MGTGDPGPAESGMEYGTCRIGYGLQDLQNRVWTTGPAELGMEYGTCRIRYGIRDLFCGAVCTVVEDRTVK